MACCDYISPLSSGIWQDIGSPASPTPNFISGWLVSPQNIGKLNNLLFTCYSGVNGCIDGALGQREQSIYGEVYKQLYWQQQISANLGAAGQMWVEMRDGDGVLRRTSPTEIAKVYQTMWKESTANLNQMITSYKLNASIARSNDFANP